MGERSSGRERPPEQEFLDRYHRRASVSGGGGTVVDLGKVLGNITELMERMDADIDTPVGVNDMITEAELTLFCGSSGLAPLLVAHIPDTAVPLLLRRYPEHLVRATFPPGYDVRKMTGVPASDLQHSVALRIFTRRLGSVEDLDVGYLTEELDPLPLEDRAGIFMLLFFMYGNKLGALKAFTGID